MKKIFIYILLAFVLIIAVLSIILFNTKSGNMLLQMGNAEYEFYIEKTIYGTDIVTIINKAINNNKKYEVEQDENGFYINDSKYSIIIEVYMIGVEEPIKMEKIYNVGTNSFIEFFNSSTFESREVRYHKETGKISEIIFSQKEQ